MHEMRAGATANGHEVWHVTPKDHGKALCGEMLTGEDFPCGAEPITRTEVHCQSCMRAFEEFVSQPPAA